MTQVNRHNGYPRYLSNNLLRLCFASALCFSAPWASAEKPVVTLKSTVTGNQEQPKVLYIVPWKANVGPETLYQNLESQMTKVFGHIERPELQREINFAQHAQTVSKSGTVGE